MKAERRGAKALNPLTVLFLIVALALAAVIFDYRVTLGMVLVMMLLAAVSGEGKAYVLLWLKSIFLMCAICFVFQVFFIPGKDIVWRFWVFSITSEGVHKAVTLCSRILGFGSAALLGIKLLYVNELMAVLEERGLSPVAAYVMLSTAKIIPQMAKKMSVILEAQKSRGIEMESNIWVRAKAFFPSVGPLLLNSIVSAEERAITLEARGFSAACKKTRLNEIPDTGMDKVIRILLTVSLILAIGGKLVWIVFA